MSKRLVLALALTTAGLLAVALGGCAPILSAVTGVASVPEEATPPASAATGSPAGPQAAAPRPAAVATLPDLASVVEKAGPAVVSIDAVSLRQGFFFAVPQEGQGTGFIIDAAGHVVTNEHVVHGADRVQVTLPDGRIFKDVPVVGRDQVTDLAVLRVPAENLPVAPLGRSAELRIGDWAIAIGNALGLGPTVTAGIVSASGREIATDAGCALKNLIQTDAAINPGNSGGPLFNLRGEVVGINTAVRRSTEGGVILEGVGYAIAIDEAMPIVRELIERGSVGGPTLGVSVVTNSKALASRYNLPTDRGVLIYEVRLQGPAAQAGLRPGSTILALEGQAVSTTEDLIKGIASRAIGDQVGIRGIDRFGREFTVRVRLDQRTCG